jgi:hypothetical protein
MASRAHSDLSIIEAVETLSSIADLELDRNVGIAQKHEVILHNEKIDYKTVHWLHKQDASSTVILVRETFRVILHYLKQFYKKEYGYINDPKTVEGIKTIMVLVGEAAKKLDKYTTLFHQSHQQSVTELKEYQQLQDFYLSRIARKIDEGVLSRWILGLSIGKLPKKEKTFKLATPTVARLDETKHAFVDLETVKKDTEYELFFIRKEDGTRFFSPRLLRNIKLVCDFGSYFNEVKETDPLANIRLWLDRFFQVAASDMIKALGPQIGNFYHDLFERDNEVSESLSKALMALMLSSHANNLQRNNPVKNCAEYFADFQVFLNEILQTRTYQKWLAYPPQANNKSNTKALDLLEMIHTLCGSLYSNLHGLEEMISIIHVLIQEASQKASHEESLHVNQSVWNQLTNDYASMTKMLKRHPNGPLLKVLEVLEENSFHVFDSLMQHNIPDQLFDLFVDKKRIDNLRLPAPVAQDFINKATVNEEFKAFLRFYSQENVNKKHLLINLQDRTSWREHARCVVLEELQQQPDFKETICVATLAIDTDFFHQLAPYHLVNHADTFIEQFKEHLKGQGSGFYFPPTLNQAELFTFIDKAIEGIHRVFFSNKNVLLREHRLDFIEIFYVFLMLKLIDMTNCQSFSLTCKDGIDIGMAYSCELFALLKFVNQTKWDESSLDFLNFMIYAPSLLIRERIMLPERFNRMVSAIRAMENAQHEHGADQFPQIIQESFGPLYKMPILQSSLLLP